MPKSLAKFIKQYLDQGYDLDTIRSHLLDSGYKIEEINASINSLYATKHVVHHLSKTTAITLAAVAIGLAIMIASVVVYLKPAQEAILDIKLEGIQTTAEPGQEITFIRELTNFGKKADVTTSYTLISVDTAATIATYQETAAVETKASRQINIAIPEDAALGNAVLNAVAEYDGKRAEAALTIKIYKRSQTATCTDNIQNQGERGIDCGGQCDPCKIEKECLPSCDDPNKCTEDYCNADTDFECKHKQIIPCCGNSICEEDETTSSCSKDCIEQETATFEGLTLSETLERIKQIAETDVRSAANYCSMVEIAMYKDTCFRNIAEVTKNQLLCDRIEEELPRDRCYASIAKSKSDSSSCESITKDSVRDSCYMNFVLDQKDYSVCDRLINKYLRDSCQTLKEAESG